jgi:hypothetical protein
VVIIPYSRGAYINQSSVAWSRPLTMTRIECRFDSRRAEYHLSVLPKKISKNVID